MDAILELDQPLVPRGNPRRPLLGLTILLVEDSRYCSEAVRLLCLKSGARLRRADSRSAAYRHLATYRPSLVIVDIGLPDGSGLDVVRDLAASRPNAPMILATSGDDPTISQVEAMAAGADGFMAKPLKNIQGFQRDILRLFPGRTGNDPAKIIPIRADVEPDTLAIGEDLRNACDQVRAADIAGDRQALAYCAQFLGSVADSANDVGLGSLAKKLGAAAEQDHDRPKKIAPLLDDLSRRVSLGPNI